MNFSTIKKRSERILKKKKGICNKSLPILDETTIREKDELIHRITIVFAIFQIALGAPISFIDKWIKDNEPEMYLSKKEKTLLSKKNENLSEKEKNEVSWYIEVLYTLMWAGCLIDDYDFDTPIPHPLASLTPDIQNSQGIRTFTENIKLRDKQKLFGMLDLLYRAHWFARDGQLNQYKTIGFNIDAIMERRKALEWLLNVESDWDNVDMST